MKIKTLLEKLKSNWPAKAVCLLIACLIYLLNIYTSLDKKSIPVSLVVVQDGDMVCSSHIPSSVSVTIQTSAENISSINGDNIHAQLDLSYFTKEGTYEVPVYVDLPPNIIGLDPLQVTVYPDKIKTRLERNTLKAAKIAPLIAGTPADGYAVEGFSCKPEYVTIYGPRSIVESIDSIPTEGIPVDDKSQGFKQTARLVNTNRLIKIYEADSAEVSVNIDYEDGIKEFKNLPILLRNIPTNFECETKRSGSITLRGPRLIMNDWTPNPDTLSADLGEITEPGEHKIPVSVLIPQEFHLENISVETITVFIKPRPPAVIVDESAQEETAENSQEGNQ